MRDHDAIHADAADKPPFSNGDEGYGWMGRWCERCIHDSDELVNRGEGCPLILTAMLGRTPVEWFEQPWTPAGVWRDGTPRSDPPADRYHCVEFRAEDDGPDPGPRPVPDPPGQSTLWPREPFEGTRMLTAGPAPAEPYIPSMT